MRSTGPSRRNVGIKDSIPQAFGLSSWVEGNVIQWPRELRWRFGGHTEKDSRFNLDILCLRVNRHIKAFGAMLTYSHCII